MQIVKITSTNPSLPLAVQVEVDAHGTVQVHECTRPKWFRAESRDIKSLDALAAWLRQLKDEPRSALIRGSFSQKSGLYHKIRRRLADANDLPGASPAFMDTPTKWLMVHIDKLRLPGGMDVVNDTAGAVAYAITQLPEEFHQASVFWQMAPRTGFQSVGTVSIHLHFWLSTPRSSAYMRAWARAVNARAGFRLMDEHLYSPIQPHQTASPALGHGVIDPLRGRRFGFIRGLTKDVALSECAYVPLPHASAFDSAEGTHRYHQHLANLGDDNAGFDIPITQALQAFVHWRGPDHTQAHRQALKVDIRTRILQADTSRHSFEDLQRYTSDAYLDHAIDGALEACGDAHPARPYFEGKEQSLEQATASLKLALEKFGEQLTRFWANDEQAVEDAPSMVIKTHGALGRAATVIRHLVANQRLEPHDIHYYAPAQAWIDQLESELNQVSTLDTFAPMAMEPTTILGRDQRDQHKNPLCPKHALAKRVADAGLNVSFTLCQSGQKRCQYYGVCGYQKQFRLDEDLRGTSITPLASHPQAGAVAARTEPKPTHCLLHNHLYVNSGKRLPKPKLIIVDEAFWRSAIVEVYVSPNDLIAVGTPIARLIHQSFLGPEPTALLHVLRSHQLTPDDLRYEAADITADAPRLTPDTPEQEIEHALTAQLAWIQIPLVLNKLADELERVEREHSHTLRYEPLDIHTNDKKRGKIVFTWRKAFALSEDVPMLFLDATASQDIVRLFKPQLEWVDIPVTRRAIVHQATDLTFSKTSLLTEPLGSARLAQVHDFIGHIAQTAPTLVVCTKDIANRLKDMSPATDNADNAGSDGRLAYVHFGDVRGRQAFLDYGNVIVVGREQPPAYAIEDQARALWWDASYPITSLPAAQKNRPLPTQVRAYRHESLKTAQVRAHPDLRVQLLIEQCREAETEQAIDRLQFLGDDASPAKHIYLLCNLPVDVTVNALVNWTELQRLLDLWQACGGILPLNPSHLAAKLPQFATSERTARRLITSINEATLLIDLLIKDVTTIRYRECKSKSKWSTALISKRHLRIGSQKTLSDFLQKDVEVLGQDAFDFF